MVLTNDFKCFCSDNIKIDVDSDKWVINLLFDVDNGSNTYKILYL